MGQKVVIRFRWESALSSASRNHLTTFCRPFVHYTCLDCVPRSLYPQQLHLFCLLSRDAEAVLFLWKRKRENSTASA